jgi:CHAD domain-containing protein
LKRVRRVAGTARDADVLIRRLTEPGTVSQANPVWEPLLRQRRKARKPIRRLFHVTEDDAWFGRGVKRLLRHIGRQTEWSDVRFDVWARSQLKHSADRFFHAAPSSDESPCLHRFRIRAKYLRYALELFAGAFPISQAEEAYRSIDAVQRELGEINDRSTGLDWLRDQLRETDDPDTFDQIRGYFLRQKEEWDRSRSAFLQSWTAGRGAVLRDRFDRLLDGEPAQDDDRGASRPPPRSRLVPMELTES